MNKFNWSMFRNNHQRQLSLMCIGQIDELLDPDFLIYVYGDICSCSRNGPMESSDSGVIYFKLKG